MKILIYLWEKDINEFPDLCEALILKYIKNNGFLENYHSFNWNYKEGSLFLGKELLIPYQDMEISEYRHLIKKKVG